MNRGANRGRGSSPMYKTCYYNTSPNPNFFANFPQEYNPDFINAQREFLLGNAGVLPLNTPPWNNYRVPQRPHPKTIASHPTPRFSHPPLPPHRRYQGPPRRELEGLSHQFQSLNVSQEPLENKLLSFFRGQREGEGLSAKRLVKSFHIEKKAINRCLYNLQKKGLLQKEEGSPPYWSITTSASQPKPSPSRSCQEEQGLVWPRNQRVIPSTHSHYPEEEPCTSSSLLLPAQSSSRNYIKEAPSEGKGDCSASHLVANSPDVMAENREKVCEYLFNSPGSTVNNIKKNTGITKPSEINQILSTLDKEGSVLKVNANPAKWSLTDKKRERMVIKKRANEIQEMESQVEDLENLVPSEEETEEVVQSMENGQQTANIKEEEVDVKPIIVDKTHVAAPPLSNKLTKEVADEAAVELAIETADEPPRKRAKAMEIADYDDEKFTMDEVPGANEEFVQGSESSKELSLLEKLQACQKKNPVSGFLEFAQYCGSHCELTLLEQSGPSHDPRFKIQAVLGNRRFPIAEASNKKVARKDAAAMALRILMHEEQGGTEEEVLETVAKTTVASKAELPTAPQLTLQSSKNPISILMEHGQRSGSMCEFKLVSQKGPPHDPKFTYEVKIGNQTFPAVVANSKKLAKQQAAEAAVKLLLGQSALQGQKFNKGSNADITESTTVRGFSEDDIKMASASGMRDLIKYLNANPVSGLLEYSRAKGFAAEFIPVSQSGPPHDPKFVYQAKVGGRYFPPVSASNKKQAKAEAADAALRVLIGEAEKSVGPMQSDIEVPLSVNTFHDQIAMLSHQKFNSLTARIQNSLLGRKILAAIIMKKDQDDVGTVVSIGTGNRCVKGEELSLRGETVNDCHAEIISRRGFIRYLYSELMKFNPSMPDDSIFEETETELLRVKNGVTFHLYISTAPCGDGALFDKSCSDQPNVDGDKRHYPIFENPKQGKLRTKVENGEGTIPVESSDIVPTWDGIQHGERLRTMSCSDKILRWNVLGLQGGILTHFIEPVYLSTVTLGYLFSKGHLTRAICCRMSRKECVLEAQLQDPYFINHPEVGRVSVYDSTRQTGKTKESSVNWCLADNEVEVLDGTKGKVDGPQLEVSRLSKVHMFILFQELSKCRQSSFQSFNSYNEVKEAATSYQTAKGQFVQALQHMSYGNWINKPQEEKSFCVV